MKLIAQSKIVRKIRALSLVAAGIVMLGGCGASDLASLESDTFLVQAMPLWLIPKLRDDYMGKRFLQPLDSARPAKRDEMGNVVAESSIWNESSIWDWTRGWPWSLPKPPPGRSFD